jgi:cytochrome bd-type quinol oxidase subunit 2
MATSKMISGLIGPTFFALAVSMLLNVGSLPALVEQASHDPAMILTTGIITFVAGLAIVRVHNRWSGGWPVVVTVLGWLFVLGGLARILFPNQLAAAAAGIAQHNGFFVGEAIVLLALGGFLSFKAYSQN